MIKLFDVVTINLNHIVYPIIYILMGIIIYNIIKNIINKMPRFSKKALKPAQAQRVKTLRILILNIIKYIVVIFVVLAILSVFGINVKSILAGLGIGTAIIGLAFQDMAKDLIAGFGIITEGTYDVGDTIEIEGFMGEVTALGLKTTQIKNYKGAVKIVANRYMDNIINYSLNNSLAQVDVSVAYEHNAEEVEKSLNNMIKELSGKLEFAKKDIEIWGVESLADSSVVYRVVVECEPTKQFTVQRSLRREIKKAFDKDGIKIPYNQIEVHNGKK